MMQSKLTKKEEKWLARMQRALDACPTDRFGFNAIGDCSVTVFDLRKMPEIDEIYEGPGNHEFCGCLEKALAILGYLEFPNEVHATAG